MTWHRSRIAVLGTGANGGSIGADLARAGLDVTFIDQWPEHVDAIRARGIRVNSGGASEVTHPGAHHLCDVAAMRAPFDVVFLLVKAYDTRWACELIAPLLSDDGALVGVQNGMTLDDIASIVGEDRAIGAVIEVGSTMFEPGVVDRHTPREKSWFAVGGLTPAAQANAERVAPLLRHAGRVEVVDDILAAKWMKLIVNAGELVPSAIIDLPMRAAIETAGMREVMRETALEAVRAAVVTGARLRPIMGMDDLDLTDPPALVEGMLDKVIHHFALPHTLTTVLQDWMKSRRSEVQEINGLVVRTLAERGLAAPYNEVALDFALRIEAGQLALDPGNLEPYIAACRQRAAVQHV